jgi:DNA-binding protein H-NS
MAGKYQQLKAQIAKLEAEAAAARKVEAAEAVATIKALMAEFDLTAEDLGFKAGRKVAKAKVAGTPKYRDPQTGKTWTGRGKPPAWMAAALKAGTAEALLISAETALASAVARKPSRPRKTAATSMATVPTAAKKRSAKAAAKGTAARPAGATKAAKRPRKKAGVAPSSAAPTMESPTKPDTLLTDEVTA